VTDDGLPTGGTLTHGWGVSGPGTVAFTDPSQLVTGVTFSAAGSHVLGLTASDGQLSTTGKITITVSPVGHGPIVNAGPNQTITNSNTAQLNGSVEADPIGGAVSYNWSLVSGPGTVTFSAPAQLPLRQ